MRALGRGVCANLASKCCCFDDVIMEVWNSHRCSWLTLHSCYGPAFPWKNVHGFQSEWFSDSAHIWIVANNNYRFLFWTEFRPPYTPDHFKQHLEAAESSSNTFCSYLLFLKNPFPEHCETKASEVHLQQIPCTEIKILNYSPRPQVK